LPFLLLSESNEKSRAKKHFPFLQGVIPEEKIGLAHYKFSLKNIIHKILKNT